MCWKVKDSFIHSFINFVSRKRSLTLFVIFPSSINHQFCFLQKLLKYVMNVSWVSVTLSIIETNILHSQTTFYNLKTKASDGQTGTNIEPTPKGTFSKYVPSNAHKQVHKKKKKKLYGPFLWMGFNCLKARATSRRQFTFYH